MALAQPSYGSVFVPSHKATAGLMVGFSRNPKDFKVNQYVQVIPVDKPIGYWATWASRQAARVRSSNLSEFAWHDGNDAPSGQDNLESNGYTQFSTNRYAFPFSLGDMTVKTADWGILQAHADMAAHQAMTARSLLTYGVWSNEANWGTHCKNIDGNGGALNGNAALFGNGVNFTTGTESNPIIKKAINRALTAINQDTLAVLGPKDLVVVMNPNTATQSSESQEIHSYLARSEFALKQVVGDAPGQNSQWALPDQLYGVKLVVDDTVIDYNQKGANPDSPQYLVDDGVVLITSRKGGLEGIGGGPAHSTLVVFYFQDDMTVESYHDVNNRLTRGRVVSNFTCNLTSAFSGYMYKRALG